MKLVVFGLLGIVGLTLAFLLLFEVILPLTNVNNGRLSVTVSQGDASVIFDDHEIGKTPFYSNHLPSGDHKLEVKTSRGTFYFSTTTTLTSGQVAVVNFDPADSQTFSAGESIYFQNGLSGLSVLTHPEGAEISLDDTSYGKAPLSRDLTEGEHILKISKPGFLPRQIKLTAAKGFKLSAVIYLAADPFAELTKVDSSQKASFFKISNDRLDLSSSYSDWVNGIIFTQNSLDGAATKFDYLIDPHGKGYIVNQDEWRNKLSSKSLVNIGYLAAKQSQPVSAAASSVWEKLKLEFN